MARNIALTDEHGAEVFNIELRGGFGGPSGALIIDGIERGSFYTKLINILRGSGWVLEGDWGTTRLSTRWFKTTRDVEDPSFEGAELRANMLSNEFDLVHAGNVLASAALKMNGRMDIEVRTEDEQASQFALRVMALEMIRLAFDAANDDD